MSKACAAFTARRVLVLSVILTALLCHAPLRAQQLDIRPFETEEDLWESLREGDISYEEYLDLLERYRLGADSAFVPISDWEELPGSDGGYLVSPDSLVRLGVVSTPRNANTARVRWSSRSGLDGNLSSPTGQDGYTTTRVRGSGWSALLHYRDDDRGGRWQRRVIEYDAGVGRVQAGNIEPRWGRGLVVGRRSRLVGADSDDPTAGDLWQPALSRFNGVRVLTRQSATLSADGFYSDIRSENLREHATAFMLSTGLTAWRIGLVGLDGAVERRDSSGTQNFRALGAHARIGTDDRALLVEIAGDDEGSTAKAAEGIWRFTHGRFHGSAWSYSSGYRNPWSGGPGHSDQTNIEIPALDETWSSRTTGERGFAFSTRVNPDLQIGAGQVRLRWDWMTHREYPGLPLRHDWTARFEWRRKSVSFRPFVRGHQLEGDVTQHSFGAFGDFGRSDYRVSMRSEFGRHREDGDRFTRLGIGGRCRLNRTIRLEPALRWVDPDLDARGDGYWYLYFTEIIFPASWWHLETALVWQRFEDRGEGDEIEVRVRVHVAR